MKRSLSQVLGGALALGRASLIMACLGRIRSLFSLAFFGLAVGLTSPASAFTVSVNSAGGNQSDCALGDCTIRGAISVACSQGAAATINFNHINSGTTITLAGNAVWLEITNRCPPITIDGGDRNITIRANQNPQRGVLYVHGGGNLTMNNLTLSGGNGRYGGDEYLGGAIFNAGTLTLNGVTVTGNSAIFAGGIFNSGTLTLNRSTVTENRATDGRADAIWNNGSGMATLFQSQVFASNTVDSEAIRNEGGFTLNRSLVSATSRSYGITNTGAFSLINSGVRASTNFVSFDNQPGGELTAIHGTFSGTFIGRGSTTANFLNSIIRHGCDLNAGVIINDLGGNLDNASGHCFTNANSVSRAGSIADMDPTPGNHGGPTLSMPQGTNSLALGRGVQAGCGHALVAGVDQRGVARPATGCTSGSFQSPHPVKFTLTGVVVGNGSVSSTGGTSTSGGPQNVTNCTPAGGTACRGFYDSGATATLTATPAANHGVVWSGACSGESNTVTVAMNQNRSCTATFAAVPVFQRAVSRKVHGTAGTFDLPINPTGNPITVEPRAAGGPNRSHDIVFQFGAPVISASAMAGNLVLEARVNGNEVTVPLPNNAPDGIQLTITLTVNGFANAASARIGFLLGDVDGSRLVNQTDVTGVRTHVGATLNEDNFIYDLDVSGVINQSDVTSVRTAVGQVLQ